MKDENGYHYDLNKLTQKTNYAVTSFSKFFNKYIGGAMTFEFNFCTWGVKCNSREVIKIQ